MILNKYGGEASANQVKPYFGLTESQKWPSEGIPEQTIVGIKLWVVPLGEKVTHVTNYGYRQIKRANINGMHSRLMAECPVCKKHLSYGRLRQHYRYNHTEPTTHCDYSPATRIAKIRQYISKHGRDLPMVIINALNARIEDMRKWT